MSNKEHKEPMPPKKMAVPVRLALVLVLLVGLLEWTLVMLRYRVLEGGPLAPILLGIMSPAYAVYLPLRDWVRAHPVLAALATAALVTAGVLLYRLWLQFWFNVIVAYLTGNRFDADEVEPPVLTFNVLEKIRDRPPGHKFIGMEQVPRRFRRDVWRPVYLTPQQQTLHRWALGKSGSGKSESVVWVSVVQDMFDGKGVAAMSAKGSDEEIHRIKALAALTGRQEQLRVFALPAWNQPHIFSHTYNMVYVRPRSKTDRGGDPFAMAERVFSVLPLGEEPYYKVQAQTMFVNLCALCHGMVDKDGNGLPFTLEDISVLFKGIGNTGGWAAALAHCLEHSEDRRAAREVIGHINRLGKDKQKVFTGIIGALDKFLSPLINAYDPDIIFEDILEKNLIVYLQLPKNLFPIQAPAMGRVMLGDIQQEGSLRQVFRHERNQTPFGVAVDEFYNFADMAIIDSLNKLRDARLEFLLANQSLADTDLVGKEYTMCVWDNTRAKDILRQDNPELCERLAKTIGTEQVVERTVRRQQGALYTSLVTGDASTKLVEAYRLHPNRIKHLSTRGQGYAFFDKEMRRVSYGKLPDDLMADYPLPAKDQTKARGLRLEQRFLVGMSATLAMASLGRKGLEKDGFESEA